MSHVTHINESCHTYEPFTCTHVNQSCHTYQWFMSHEIHVYTYGYVMCTHTNESGHTYESCHTCIRWVTSHTWISHVTHMNESCHTYEWVTSYIWMSHVTNMNESCESGIRRQDTAAHCNTLRHIATHCNTLQHTATCHIGIRRVPTPFATTL